MRDELVLVDFKEVVRYRTIFADETTEITLCQKYKTGKE